MNTSIKHSIPRICLVNFPHEFQSMLGEYFSDDFLASIGNIIDTSGIGNKYLYPKQNLPENIHEYDLFLIDTGTASLEYYNEYAHGSVEKRSVEDQFCIYVTAPLSSIDTRPYGLGVLDEKLRSINKEILIVLFPGIYRKYKYYQYSNGQHYEYSCDTLPFFDFQKIGILDRKGYEISTGENTGGIMTLLTKYLTGASYNCSFILPQVPGEVVDGFRRRYVNDPAFQALQTNSNREVISFKFKEGNRNYLVLPI
jgi:hypothetical protein